MSNKRIAVECPEGCMVFDIAEYDDGVALTHYLTDDLETVILPDQVDGKPVTDIGPGCFFNHPEITSIVFPETLQHVRESAFALCRGIRTLILPDSVTEIGIHAFRDCTGLRKVVLPSGLKQLKTGTFSFDYFPDNVEFIVKDGLETIEPAVFFSGGLSLSFVLRLPDSVVSIADGAFEPGMYVLTSLPYNARWFAK